METALLADISAVVDMERFQMLGMRQVVTVMSSCAVVCSAAHAQVIYSESFDAGTVGESITNAQFGFQPQFGSDDMRLGAAVHGWTGNSIIGASAAPGLNNQVYLPISLPSHGLLELSADMYSYGNDISQLGLGFFHDAFSAADHFQASVEAEPANWQFTTFPNPRNEWDSPAGMHDEVVHAEVFWNQDTGETWTVLIDGSQVWESSHAFYAATGQMTGIELEIDRRSTSKGGDIDNLQVRVAPAGTPEPLTTVLGLFGAGIFLRGKLRAPRLP